jgi:hypothetical protein
MTITASGGEPPKFKFSGGAMGYALAGVSAVLSTVTSSNQVEITHDNKIYSFMVGSYISVGSNDALLVTAVNTSTYTLTVDATISAAIADVVQKYNPTASGMVGSPLPGLWGSCSIAGVSIPITSFELSLKNQDKPIEDEAFAQFATDVIPGLRTVTGTIGFRLRKDLVSIIGRRNYYVQPSLAVVMKTSSAGVAGKILTLTMGKVSLDFSAIEVPESEEATVSLPFTAMGSTDSDDELTVVFT